MNKLTKIALAAVSLGTAAFSSSVAHAQVQVDLELALLVDVSGSVNSTEYNLQKQGYVQAFQSAAIQNLILNGALGRIAVTYIEWSGSGQQSIEVPWFLIDSVSAANNFAAAVNAATRNFSGSTGVASAINFGAAQFASNGYDAARQVIDVSGDGSENTGGNTIAARNAALALGIDTINGVVILNDEPGLGTWYTNNVIGGTGAFVEVATTFADFSDAINRKLFREIGGETPVPEPSTYGLIGAASLLGVVAIRRKRMKASPAA